LATVCSLAADSCSISFAPTVTYANMILCLGTTPALARTMVFDEVVADDINRAHAVYETAAGKSINVAKVVQTLGEEVIATGFLGGETGKFIRAQLDMLKVKHQFVDVRPPTRTCISVIDEANGQSTELIEESQPIDPAAWDQLRRTYKQLVAKARIVVLSGSLPPEASVDFYGECVREATLAKARCIIDAKGDPLAHAIFERPYLIKPNEQELADTTGVPIDSDLTLREGIRQVLHAGAGWCIVTRGADPAIVAGNEGSWQLTPPEVEITSTIGSGDALAAGLAVGLLRGMSVPDAAKLGIACGTANAKTLLAGLVRLDDVYDLHPQVQIAGW
jgi:tagatose 6-phosphate kinase